MLDPVAGDGAFVNAVLRPADDIEKRGVPFIGMDMGLAEIRKACQQHAVITDLGMPRLDGRQLAQILKKESPSTPVIMMTGWATLMKGEEDLPLHVDGVLNKPPKITELQETLRRVTQRKNGQASP